MAASTLTGSITHSVQATLGKTQTGTDYSPLAASFSLSKKISFAGTTANNAAGGADDCISYIVSIAASGTSTIDLQALNSLLQLSAGAIVRIKGWQIRLLDATDDATNGTACTDITVGNAASNAQQLNLTATHTMTIYSGGSMSYVDRRAGGFTVSASAKDLKIVNNDSSAAAAVQLTFFTGST